MKAQENIIVKLYNRWMVVSVLSDVLLALAFTLVVTAVLNNQFQPTWWLDAYIFFMAMIGLGVRSNVYNLHPADFARHLNSRMPQFQESAELLLKPAASLSMLEKLQTSRVEQAINEKPVAIFPEKKLRWAVGILLISLLLAKCLYPLPDFLRFSKPKAVTEAAVAKRGVVEKRPTGILSVDVQVTPPAYTGIGSMHQSSFTIQTPEGAAASWQLVTNNAVGEVQLIFNDKERVAMQATDSSHKKWTLFKKLTGSGFYQVKLEGKLSDMYMIDLVKDQPPQVRILHPKQYTTIDFGQPQRVGISVNAQDDYGLSNAFMTATIASGSGEAVKFKEERLPLAGLLAGRRETALQRALDLRALGMKPGDELYYYVSVSDNRAQETRSDVYTIVLPDTAQLMEIEGLTNSVNLKLEYFRSQRQIIIETEQLLKDRDTISAAAFNNKSNNLGIDQKLLRLRYGKFLGEENENEIGEHGHGEEQGEHNQTVFGDATKLMQQYVHEHDNAEDATFFDPKLKAQLRATLSEMWKAELQLRLYKPQQALPYEYKALRMLKDLQQQSRSYVAKSAYKTTPLRPEKRLTADLSKITQPVTKQSTKPPGKEKIIQEAAGILEALNQGARPTPTAAKTLQAAAQQLGAGAIQKPVLYLSSFEALKRVLRLLDHPEAISVKDISLAEKGLQTLTDGPDKSPRRERAGTSQSLSQQYFSNLQQTNR